MNDLTHVAPGIWLVDTHQFGVPHQGGVYLIPGKPAALVESGTSLSRTRILQALACLDVDPADVAWIFVTHVHLDHAGGAGALLEDLPAARVVVHERGVRHLADPTRLVASVKEAVQDRFPLYGDAVPIPPERLHAAQDGECFRLGKFSVQAVDSPGHAPHHLCFFEQSTGSLFSGDAAGLYLGGKLLPTTVPPSFELDAALATLDRLIGLQPRLILFTHFGPGEPTLLATYKELLRGWVNLVRHVRDQGASEEEIVETVLQEATRRGWTSTGPAKADLKMSVRGALGYLARRAGQA